MPAGPLRDLSGDRSHEGWVEQKTTVVQWYARRAFKVNA